MCGRFILISDLSEITSFLPVAAAEETPRHSYNIAPGTTVTALLREERNRLGRLRWGYLPPWVRNGRPGRELINARGETVTSKPAFREAFLKRRCLVLANGYYEWRREGRRKIPWFIHLEANRLFAFAGIYDRVEEKTLPGVAIITTEPAPAIHDIHNRMPVILVGESAGKWLDLPAAAERDLHSLLKPYPGEDLSAHAVSTFVNAPSHDSPRCIAPVTET